MAYPFKEPEVRTQQANRLVRIIKRKGSGFHGFGEGDYQALEDRLFKEQMAGIASDLGARGLESSSMMAQGAAAARGQAQRTRFGLQAQEQARRTAWEQQQSMFAWQKKQQRFQNRMQRQEFQKRREEADRMWVSFMGGLSGQNYWNIMGRVNELLTPGQSRRRRRGSRGGDPYLAHMRRLSGFWGSRGSAYGQEQGQGGDLAGGLMAMSHLPF